MVAVRQLQQYYYSEIFIHVYGDSEKAYPVPRQAVKWAFQREFTTRKIHWVQSGVKTFVSMLGESDKLWCSWRTDIRPLTVYQNVGGSNKEV